MPRLSTLKNVAIRVAICLSLVADLLPFSDGQSTIEISSIVRNRPTLHPWDVCFWMVTVSKIEIASPILSAIIRWETCFLKGWIGSPLHDGDVKAPILHMATVRWYEPQRWEVFPHHESQQSWGLVQDISKVNEVTLVSTKLIGKWKVQLEEAIAFGSGFWIYWKLDSGFKSFKWRDPE